MSEGNMYSLTSSKEN